MQIEKTGLFLSPLCQIFNRAQQTCAIFMAVVHGTHPRHIVADPPGRSC